MTKLLVTNDEALDLLARLPESMAQQVAGITDTQATRPPAPGEWSLVELLAHLRSCADVWGNSLATILAEDRPTIRAVSPRTWVHRTDYPTQPFSTSFAAYQAQRADLLALLHSLPPDAWERSATVVGAGKPQENSLAYYVERISVHERTHRRQWARTAAEALAGPKGTAVDRSGA